ncbi:tripartite tricarboxylate transporter substrate binding protein [Nitratireductor luteus]|uniref:tripartite tricarboxylate transporter substrate binding protein n=1 Tax=Nitratireductor luteus TaxID=2976980 RepID=UPI00223FC6AF|nr:tripartite tricarboxylate transporter substrate binding protein [Nitratireductor luteus]
MRIASLVAAGTMILSLVGPANAQKNWPDKPIEFVCATSPGSGAANWCLLVSELLGEKLGVPIEVLFKPAGAGNEGATYVNERPADGYTWLQRNTSYGGYMNLPTFRPDPNDFEVAVEVEKFLYVLAVNADSPYETWDDLAKAMKEAGEPIPVAANKPGSVHHLHLVKLFEAAGLEWTYVPYDGAGGAMRDTLGGHIDVAIGPPGIWQPHVDAGTARYLLLINEEHVDRPGLSDLPIPSDFGIDYEMIHQVQGIFTKAGTPQMINDKIAEAFEAAMKSERYAEYLEANQHVVPAFSADMEKNTERFRTLLDTMKTALKNAGVL